jgi:hypothetical protein
MRQAINKSGPRPRPIIVAILISVALLVAFALVTRYGI